jgi:predicted GNAT family acetyltransferase
MTNVDGSTLRIENNERAHRWQAQVGQFMVVAEYRRSAETIFFTSTRVPRELEGQGIASKLIKTALDAARAQHLAVVPICTFVAGYIRRHPEYQDLVHPDYRHLVEDAPSE